MAEQAMDFAVEVWPEFRCGVVECGVCEVETDAGNGGTDSPVLLRVVEIGDGAGDHGS